MLKFKALLALLACSGTIYSQTYFITAVAGNGQFGGSGNGGQATAATFGNVNCAVVDASGNIYITDGYYNVIRKVDGSTGIISTIAGTTVMGFSGDGGPATSAQLNTPSFMALDANNDLYFSDSNNGRVRVINLTSGTISTVAGNGGPHSGDNISATSAGLSNPRGLAINAAGDLFIAESGNGQIRKVSGGTISTIVGNGNLGYSGDGGPALSAALNAPMGIAFSGSDLYICDAGNNRVRYIDHNSNNISTAAGSFNYGYGGDGGAATSAYLYNPMGICFNSSGFYIADCGNNRIRKVSGGIISTIAGNGTAGLTGNGGAALSAELNAPHSICADPSSSALYIGDYSNYEVRKLCVAPVISSQPVAASVCSGSNTSFSVTASSSPAPSYQWQVNSGSGFTNISNAGVYTGATSSSLSITGATLSMSGYTYQCLLASGSCVNEATNAVALTVHPLPAINVNSATVCKGKNATLTASGAVTYSWSNGASSASITPSPTTTTTYTVTGTDANNCVNSNTATVTVHTPSVPQICLVTSDSLSKVNIVVWDKTLDADADSFLIYREVSTGTYKRIGAQPKASLSQFIDTVRSIGPANGDPNISTYRYKISILDTCGNESAMSPYHNTVYFTDNHNGSFSWNTYNVEGMTNTPVTTFDLIRDDNNTGVWHVVASSAGTANLLTDPNWSAYQNTANWRVNANGFNCVPTMLYGSHGMMQKPVIKAASNTRNNRILTTGIRDNQIITLSVYPNPADNQLTVSLNAFPADIQLYDVSGRILLQTKTYTESTQLDISSCSSGIYFLKVMIAGHPDRFFQVIKN
ncbi:MAG TPA: T9SS type A sorting domain-containing protein [Bacteroidia bacterium]|nr:T9SS type A sorting domain-containing protein [Bacteroidia bacterium]